MEEEEEEEGEGLGWRECEWGCPLLPPPRPISVPNQNRWLITVQPPQILIITSTRLEEIFEDNIMVGLERKNLSQRTARELLMQYLRQLELTWLMEE